jgi:hypothetical protein
LPHVHSGSGLNTPAGGMYWQVGSALLGRHSSSDGSHTKPSSQLFISGLVAHTSCMHGPAGTTHSPR